MTLNELKNKIFWRAFYKNLVSEEEFNSFLNSIYMPYKGYGGIQVLPEHKEQAILLLKDIVDKYEFEYYPDGFINEFGVSDSFYYGKFHIENLKDFIQLLIKNNITIVNIEFYQPEAD